MVEAHLPVGACANLSNYLRNTGTRDCGALSVVAKGQRLR